VPYKKHKTSKYRPQSQYKTESSRKLREYKRDSYVFILAGVSLAILDRRSGWGVMRTLPSLIILLRNLSTQETTGFRWMGKRIVGINLPRESLVKRSHESGKITKASQSARSLICCSP